MSPQPPTLPLKDSLKGRGDAGNTVESTTPPTPGHDLLWMRRPRLCRDRAIHHGSSYAKYRGAKGVVMEFGICASPWLPNIGSRKKSIKWSLLERDCVFWLILINKWMKWSVGPCRAPNLRAPIGIFRPLQNSPILGYRYLPTVAAPPPPPPLSFHRNRNRPVLHFFFSPFSCDVTGPGDVSLGLPARQRKANFKIVFKCKRDFMWGAVNYCGRLHTTLLSSVSVNYLQVT
ncbi:hypothetical protein CEXT_718481 [Caerostris extrusa]|uniref:Uncharacterized protein n=1 Tax=Caerostris extrusa TaxID=172846 RepID=A0AAV4MN54_CAEEX|nr:hypothetical protein CEXT_718481 [Caerostris extrusa]